MIFYACKVALYMEIKSTDLTIREILHYIRIAQDTVGSKWIHRKIKEESNKRAQDRRSVESRKHSYLYRKKPHSLIDWAIEADQWRQRCLQTGRMELNQAILKFAILGRALERARAQKGFSRLIHRLKQPDQFDAAGFEVEVASNYWRARVRSTLSKKETKDLRTLRSLQQTEHFG
jgi:hypothetical protein